MPELNIGNGQHESLEALYVLSRMLFPEDEQIANEFCARERLEVIKKWCLEHPEKMQISNSHDLNFLAWDLDVILNSKKQGQELLHDMATTRTTRGLWSGHVLFQIISDLINDNFISIKTSRISAFELLEQVNKYRKKEWWPEGEKNHGQKTFEHYRSVCHLWCALLRVFLFVDSKSDNEVTYQQVFVDNFQSILSLAFWIYNEIESKYPKRFFDPYKTWRIPESYPLQPVSEVSTLMTA